MKTNNQTQMINNPSVRRRGILFIYGAEWCNPNGDPSFDNEPRVRGGKVFVTDVFLKRRIRDYIYSKYRDKEGKIVLIREIIRPDGSRPTIEERVAEIIGEEDSKKSIEDLKGELIKKCWDVRVFGVLAPLPKRKSSIKLIGPTQATFGISLNEVEKINVSITNVMASKEERAGGGTIGEKHIVPVAIIEQYIFINDIVANETGMTENDYEDLLEALKNFGIIPTSRTSSKNIYPIAIIEVEFENEKYANLMGMIEVTTEVPEIEKITKIRDYRIKLSKLINLLKNGNKNDKLVKDYKIYIKSDFKEIVDIGSAEDLKDSGKIEYF